MASKTTRVVIIDATTKKLEADLARAKANSQATSLKKTKASKVMAKKLPLALSEKKSVLPGKSVSDKPILAVAKKVAPIAPVQKSSETKLQQAVKQATEALAKKPANIAEKSAVVETVAIESQKGTIKKTKEKKEETSSAPAHIGFSPVKIRRLSSLIPPVKQGTMRVVAYVGVLLVLIGVSTASFALARISSEDPDSIVSHIARSVGIQMASSLDSGSGILTTTTTTLTAPTYVDTSIDTSTSTTTSTTGTLATTTTSSTTTFTTALTPSVTFHYSESMPFSNQVSILLQVSGANKIELALTSQNALTPFYLGNANFNSETVDQWRYVFDTKNVPNGPYYLVARITNRYGSYEAPHQLIGIRNVIASSTSETTYVAPSADITTTVKSIEGEMGSTLNATTTNAADDSMADASTTDASAISPVSTKTTVSTSSLVASSTSASPAPQIDPQKEAKLAKAIVDAQIAKFKENLTLLIERYAVAYRAKDTNTEAFIKGEIQRLKDQTISSLKERQVLVDGNYSSIATQLLSLIDQEISRIETREKMIQERVGDGVAKDTDKDGIVDYDEIHLYHTDPTVADTDHDGFTDGAEVASGYNPTDPNREAPIAFESPASDGPTRADILAVASIDTEHKNDGTVAGAKLSGTGLPNSFVTLYIFSTPVVVTVRTSDDGSWSYVFDKELENGAHTVYVGITDNAGRIVAKSNAFPFVKTAEAYAGGAPLPTKATAAVSGTLLSQNSILLIGALLLTLLGTALVALGAYFMRPRADEMTLRPA